MGVLMPYQFRKRYFLYTVVVAIFIFLILHSINFSLAYISLSSECGYKTEQQLKESGYSKQGAYYPSEGVICFYGGTNASEIKETKEFKRTITHETCHARQDRQGRLFGCNNPFLLYLNELECYFMEDILVP